MKKLLLFIVCCFCWGGTVWAQAEEQEANLKAAFIYNFTRYIEWSPEQVSDEFVIGVIGQSSVTRSLNLIARNSKVGNKKISIRYYEKPDEIGYCNILFISQNANIPLPGILKKVEKGVLTISEQPGYAREGTAFNFVLLNEKLKFEVNLKSFANTGLKASSQLLKLAIIVEQ